MRYTRSPWSGLSDHANRLSLVMPLPYAPSFRLYQAGLCTVTCVVRIFGSALGLPVNTLGYMTRSDLRTWLATAVLPPPGDSASPALKRAIQLSTAARWSL